MASLTTKFNELSLVLVNGFASAAVVSGFAFVLEGATERVFYERLLYFFARKHPNCSIEKNQDSETFETFFTVRGPFGVRIIKMNAVGTITQMQKILDCSVLPFEQVEQIFKMEWIQLLRWEKWNSLIQLGRFGCVSKNEFNPKADFIISCISWEWKLNGLTKFLQGVSLLSHRHNKSSLKRKVSTSFFLQYGKSGNILVTLTPKR